MRNLIFIILLQVSSVGATQTQHADIILMNGKLFIDGAISKDKDSVAIKDGRILSIIQSKEVSLYKSSKTHVIDVKQDLIIPGIIDAHMHSVMRLGNVENLDLGKINPSKAEISQAINSAVKKHPEGTWLFITIGEKVIDNPNVNANFLDQLSPKHPVWLGTYYGHGDIMNSLAMKAFDIGSTPEENFGGFYERDQNNQLTGRLYEYAHWVPRAKMVNLLSDEQVIDILRSKANASLEYGITSWHDMPMLEFNRYIRLLEQAKLPIRVTAIPLQYISADKNSEVPNSKSVSDTIRVAGEKWILDGTPIERGAALTIDYADKPGWQGRMNFSQESIGKILDEIISRGKQPLFHISGDKALAALLNEMEKRRYDWTQLRVRIEHGDGVNTQLILRARKLGIVIVQNPSHFMNKDIGSKRIPKDHPFMLFKSLIESDIPVAIGSDGPFNPYLNMMFAQIHQARPQEGVEVSTALQLYTEGSAYAGKQESELGQLKQGMKADLAVLTQNILEIPLEKLPITKSKLTIINGQIVYWQRD